MATEYNIGRTAGQCVRCGRKLEEREEYVAALVEQGETLERHDWCLPCWQAPDRGEVASLFSTWRARIPMREAKKRLFVDDEVLVNFFQRLAGEEDRARQDFRFVLALVLMRKRMLAYERAVKGADGGETWVMRLKTRGIDEAHEVVNPRLDEERIAQVTEQLTTIMQGEL